MSAPLPVITNVKKAKHIWHLMQMGLRQKNLHMRGQQQKMLLMGEELRSYKGIQVTGKERMGIAMQEMMKTMVWSSIFQ